MILFEYKYIIIVITVMQPFQDVLGNLWHQDKTMQNMTH